MPFNIQGTINGINQIVNSASGIANQNTTVPGNGWTDILDKLGIGTQRRAQQFNSAEAALQRTWQEEQTQKAYEWQEKMQNQAYEYQTEMSNTAYQRAVADMQKAGLNPALMYNSASPASTPNASIGSASIPSGNGASIGGGGGGSNLMTAITSLINAHNTSKALDKNYRNNKQINYLIKLLK